MKHHTNFLINILSQNDINMYDYDIIKCIELIVSNINELDSHQIHLILSLLEDNDMFRYQTFELLNRKIDALTVEDLVLIIKCFDKSEYKYEVFIKSIKKCLLNTEYYKISEQFIDLNQRIDVDRIIHNVMNDIVLGNLLSSLKNFESTEERLELLEKSITRSNISLMNSEEYCEYIKEIFDDKYEEGCMILGINPEYYKQFM